MIKYRFTGGIEEHMCRELYAIRAFVDSINFKSGDLGGCIEKEENLSHGGNCWISDGACVCGDARVYNDAWIHEYARVFGNAKIFGNAEIFYFAHVSDNTQVFGNAEISGFAEIYEYAQIYDDAIVSGSALISGNARISGNAYVSGYAHISGNAHIGKDALITHNNDWFCVDNVGSEHDTITFYKGTHGAYVCADLFNDTLDEFIEFIKIRHRNDKEQYMLCVELARRNLIDKMI